MKKSILLLGFTLLVFLSAFAKNVDLETAMNVAKTFYNTRATITSTVDKLGLAVSLAYKCNLVTPTAFAKATDENVYYIFNINTNDGFVIIAGDDIVTPILGYSNKGTYDSDNLPPAFQKLLENYKQQILFAKENQLGATEEIEKNWDELINSKDDNALSRLSSAQTVNPLLTTTWDQGQYYNDQCPGGSVTGCVATAMAQIMKYWNAPVLGTGFHSYSDANYGVQSANFANATYNWGAMPNNVSSSNAYVATLMYHCGVSVDMSYSVTGSYAYVISAQSPGVQCAEYAYKTYFGYNPATIQGLERVNYSFTAWKNLLKNELDNNRPIQYAGFGGGGHTFVCDGYDVNEFFHMNWGWGGIADGFFDLDALNPTQLGTGSGLGTYNSGQQAVIGIQPVSGGGPASAIDLYSSISVSPNPIDFAMPFTVNADVVNNATSAFSGDFCATLFTSSGIFIDNIQILSASGSPLPAGSHYTGGLDFTSTGMLTVPGNYIIGIFYRDAGGQWRLAGDASFTNPVSVTINSPVDYIQQYSPIVATPSTFIQGQPGSVNVNLINDNTATYFGVYEAALYDLNGNFVQSIGTYNETLGLNPGFAYTSPFITFSTAAITAPPGTYILAIIELENGFTTPYLVGGQYFPTPVNMIVVEPQLSPDTYEPNDSQGAAYTLPLTWAGNNAHPLTTGSNNHVGADYDYYKINLPGGYNYIITARVHDSYNSGNGNTYTNDVLWAYDDGTGSSLAFDDVMPGNIVFNGAGTITFLVSPYFAGQTGTYLLDININRTSTVGINELNHTGNLFEIYPNPAINNLSVKFADHVSIQKLKVLNVIGQIISETKPTQSLVNIDLSALPNGMYFLEATENYQVYSSKFIINR